MKKKDEKIISKIRNSNHLFSIYFYILNNKNFMQKDIIKNLPITYHSHVSTAIKFFRENNLIECKNPKDKNYKLYEAKH